MLNFPQKMSFSDYVPPTPQLPSSPKTQAKGQESCSLSALKITELNLIDNKRDELKPFVGSKHEMLSLFEAMGLQLKYVIIAEAELVGKGRKGRDFMRTHASY